MLAATSLPGFQGRNLRDEAVVGGVAGTGWSEREGRKDGNEWAQVFDREWAGGGFGLGASRSLLKSLTCCNGPTDF